MSFLVLQGKGRRDWKTSSTSTPVAQRHFHFFHFVLSTDISYPGVLKNLSSTTSFKNTKYSWSEIPFHLYARGCLITNFSLLEMGGTQPAFLRSPVSVAYIPSRRPAGSKLPACLMVLLGRDTHNRLSWPGISGLQHNFAYEEILNTVSGTK